MHEPFWPNRMARVGKYRWPRLYLWGLCNSGIPVSCAMYDAYLREFYPLKWLSRKFRRWWWELRHRHLRQEALKVFESAFKDEPPTDNTKMLTLTVAGLERFREHVLRDWPDLPLVRHKDS